MNIPNLQKQIQNLYRDHQLIIPSHVYDILICAAYNVLVGNSKGIDTSSHTLQNIDNLKSFQTPDLNGEDRVMSHYNSKHM